MGGLARSLLTSAVDIVSKHMEYLLPWDAAPAQALRDQQAAFLRSKTDGAAYQRFQTGMKKIVDQEAVKLEILPLRSLRHKGRPLKRDADDEDKARGERRGEAPMKELLGCAWAHDELVDTAVGYRI